MDCLHKFGGEDEDKKLPIWCISHLESAARDGRSAHGTALQARVHCVAVCVAEWSLQDERWKDIKVTGFIVMADWGLGGGLGRGWMLSGRTDLWRGLQKHVCKAVSYNTASASCCECCECCECC